MVPEKRKTLIEDEAVEGVAELKQWLARERQAAQGRKLEAVGRLAAGVAHDFNNLLTAIIGYSNLALLKLGESDPSREHIAQINRAGERAAELTQQLLAFSCRQMLSPEIVDPGAMIRKMEPLLQRLIGPDVELLTAVDPSLQAVKADLGQLEQVVTLLAMNARDAMPQGGKLVVEARNAEVTAESERVEGMVPGRYVVLGISDTGEGMDESALSRLFEPYAAIPARDGKPQSQQMGLATVYGIVKQSGGYLQVDSRPGRGSIFRIYLAAAGRAGIQDWVGATARNTAGTHGNETILVAEDEPAVRDFLRDALEHNGYRVLEAANGEEALDKAAAAASRGATLPGSEGDIRLLVTDMVMGGMNGRQLADEVLGLLPGIKVLYISGYAEQALGGQSVFGESPAFLRKPFSPGDLARKIRSMLDGG